MFVLILMFHLKYHMNHVISKILLVYIIVMNCKYIKSVVTSGAFGGVHLPPFLSSSLHGWSEREGMRDPSSALGDLQRSADVTPLDILRHQRPRAGARNDAVWCLFAVLRRSGRQGIYGEVK